jgi:hypothetical protein
LRVKHYSLRTEQAYVYWIRRYIRSNGLRHPRELGGVDAERFMGRGEHSEPRHCHARFATMSQLAMLVAT